MDRVASPAVVQAGPFPRVERVAESADPRDRDCVQGEQRSRSRDDQIRARGSESRDPGWKIEGRDSGDSSEGRGRRSETRDGSEGGARSDRRCFDSGAAGVGVLPTRITAKTELRKAQVRDDGEASVPGLRSNYLSNLVPMLLYRLLPVLF